MKDIDFDELDRAVNSLMGGVPKNNPVKSDDSEVVLRIGPDIEPDSSGSAQQSETPVSEPQEAKITAEDSQTDEVAQAPAEEQPASASSVVQPSAAPFASRRGRIMDVVRPSAARSGSRPAPSSAVSRQASVIEPVKEVAPEAPEAPDATAAPDPTADLPDPMTFQPRTETDQNPMTEAQSTTPQESSEQPQEISTNDPAPLDSPFLPGAKVEKRPLGRPAESASTLDLMSALDAASSEPATSSSASNASNMSDERDAQLPEQPVPAEFDSKLLSIETGADSVPQTPPVETAPEAKQPVARESNATPATQGSGRAMAVTSIPQQYKVQPQAENPTEPAGTIYDAQPLMHPEKKKPGWVWLLAILGVILLGVGFGVAFYYLGLN